MSKHCFIAEFIKKKRKAHDLTQEELAEFAGVDKNWIDKLENDSSENRQIENFMRLMTVLGRIEDGEKLDKKLDWSHLPQLSIIFSKIFTLDPKSVQSFITLFPKYRRIALRLRDD